MSKKIQIPETLYTKTLNRLSVLLIIGSFLYLPLIWGNIPSQIPIHYDAYGQIDNWAGKASLWLEPVLSLILYLMISACERHPALWNTGVTVTEENQHRIYRILKNLVVTTKFTLALTFAVITVYSSLALAFPSWYLPVNLLFVFAPIIFFLIQLFRNR